MKIVHVVYSLEMGGAEVLVGQLARIQRANGHEVSVCAYSQLGAVGEALKSDGVDIFVPGEAHPARTMLRYFRHFRRLRPDIVHCHNVAPTLQAALPARLAGASCVVATRHSLVSPPYAGDERKFSLIARACDRIVGICEITCANLRGAPLAQPDKIIRVYNGAVPMERVDTSNVEKRGFTLLFVGRLATVKDLGTMLRGFAHALTRDPNLNLWIVGDGIERQRLEALAHELDIADRVTFWGQRMDTARFFSAADAFTISSVSEGLPMSLLQAMSIGLPAVVTDVGGMAEVVRSAGCGLLAPVGNPAALGDAMLRLANEAELRAGFSHRAVAVYQANFTLEHMDRAYMEIYTRGR